MPDPWRPAFEALDERWSAEHKRQRASPGGVRETFFRAGFEAALREKDPKPDDAWTCIVCERTFTPGQPRFVDYVADQPAVADLCIDCSH